MSDLLAVAIGIGLAVSLVFSELFGLAAGGMVVPGYIALYLHRPLDVLLTLVAALVSYFIVYLLANVIIIYGKRRTVLMILVGYLVRMLMDSFADGAVGNFGGLTSVEVSVIGYIIPGLVAIWIDRQGLAETISTLLTASIVVRLLLILIFSSEFQL